MAKHSKHSRTDDKHIEGVERIDAPPEELARALFKRPARSNRRNGKPAREEKDETHGSGHSR